MLCRAHSPDTPQVYNDSFLAGFNGPFPTITGYAGTEISSTVSLLYQTDWDVNYVGRAADDWSSKCIDMLYRANESKAKVVNFMVTHYWVDDNFDGKVGGKRCSAEPAVQLPAACLCWAAAVQCSCESGSCTVTMHTTPVAAAWQIPLAGAPLHQQVSTCTPCTSTAAVNGALTPLVFMLGAQVEYYCHKIRWGEGERSGWCAGAAPTGAWQWHAMLAAHDTVQCLHMLDMPCGCPAPAGCPKINRLAIDRFRFGLQWCLAKAVDMVRVLSGYLHTANSLSPSTHPRTEVVCYTNKHAANKLPHGCCCRCRAWTSPSRPTWTTAWSTVAGGTPCGLTPCRSTAGSPTTT